MDITPVRNKKDLMDFLRVPEIIYRDNPHYPIQLYMERKEHFSSKNPYFQHATHQLFVAREGNVPVGRISAQIDEFAVSKEQRNIGHFGFLEAKNDDIFQALLRCAEEWLKSHGITHVGGPYSFSINDEVGLLVDGFNDRPRLLMNYAQEWYEESLNKAGYAGVKDLIAYSIDTSSPPPPRLVKMAEASKKYQNIVMRPINMRRLKKEMRIVMDVFNDAWKENWGFIPMTEAEIGHMVSNMKLLIDPKFVRVAEKDGYPFLVSIALPDLNEVLMGLKGRLFPFGWLKLLWRLKVKKPTSIRLLIMGLRPDMQRNTLSIRAGSMLFQQILTEAKKQGIRDIECSWILEDNAAIINIIEFAGGKIYKRYRLYEKALG